MNGFLLEVILLSHALGHPVDPLPLGKGVNFKEGRKSPSAQDGKKAIKRMRLLNDCGLDRRVA